MEEYAYSKNEDDDDLDIPLVRKPRKKSPKSISISDDDLDVPLVRKKPQQITRKSPPAVQIRPQEEEEEFFTYEEETKTKSPERGVIDYTSLYEKEFKPGTQTKKKVIKKKSPEKEKQKPIDRLKSPVKSPPKAKKIVEYSEDQCEKFIEAANKVGPKEKFVNPITKKEITKGSAAYNKYLKDCQNKLTVETQLSIKEEKQSDLNKFGQRKVFSCDDYKIKSTGAFEPNPHQIKARNRFLRIMNGEEKGPGTEKLRGLLLYYGLGSGKTCTYAMIADLFHQKFPDRPIFIFTPGSLRTNFLEQYCSFCGLKPNDVAKSFAFYSINDTSIIRKLPKRLNNSLVIIDEVHKLTHGKSNDSPIISLIYDIISNSENVLIVSGSGTPVETSIDELFYLTNLHIKDKFDTLPEFKGLFKWKEGVFYPKNKDKLEELFSSFISYYDPQKTLETTNKKAFPTVYYKNVYVPINPERERAYMDIVSQENENIKKPNEDLKFSDYERYKKQKQKYYIAASRLRSSQESNFSYPILDKSKRKTTNLSEEGKATEGKATEGDLTLAEEEGGTDELPSSSYTQGTAVASRIPDTLEEEGGWINKDLLKILYDQGEKISQIVKDIETNEGKHAVYTRFKTYYGSRLLGAILDLKGIPYVYFDGDMNDKDRVKVLERFNSPDNINGDKIKVIILTSAGSAGINLKEIRRFHILEQYFNLSYLKQVVGRGNRYLSHQRLPENKRNLTVLNYFIQLSDDEITDTYSSDVLSYKSGKKKDNSISAVRELLTTLDI
jgi:superfamily II DNA or RNA helicase